MASSEDYEIVAANDLREGNYALMKGKTCKVLEIHRSKTGKHGGAKLHLVGLDLFTRRKVEDIIQSTHTLNVPQVKKDDYKIMSLQGDTLVLQAKDMTTREDIQVPESDDQKKIAKHLRDGHNVYCVVVSAMGKETYDSFKRKY
jgi:translation initiation factor 5A